MAFISADSKWHHNHSGASRYIFEATYTFRAQLPRDEDDVGHPIRYESGVTTHVRHILAPSEAFVRAWYVRDGLYMAEFHLVSVTLCDVQLDGSVSKGWDR